MSVRFPIAGRVVLSAALLLLPWAASAQSLTVSPATLNVQAAPGGSIPSQTVTITKSGGGKWSITNIAPWITVSRTSGSNSGTTTVNFLTTNRPPASVTGALAFTVSTPTSTPVNVLVNLTV